MRLLLIVAASVLITEAVQIKSPNGQIYNDVIKYEASPESEGDNAKQKEDIYEINKNVKGLVHGDVVPRQESKSTIIDTDYFWPDHRIPVTYTALLSLEAIGSIELARQEYRLRTCLDFVDATEDDRNYIRYITGNGCYSSVGMVGRGQTISIGIGCERLGTVCHEMMHAIGVWHEQMRADRDDYVQIMWDRLRPGTEGNFAKVDWDETDARRVPYDYTSIMHYSDTGFSTTGEPTIVTLEPKYQDIIGQRNTFSKGDTDKINRMYKCSDTLLVSYNCNFDDRAACGYVQDFDSDSIDWLYYEIGDNSLTLPPSAPSTDATLGIPGKGSYMILDTSDEVRPGMAEMRSRRFVTRSEVQCLQFSYYMNVAANDTSSIVVYLASLDDVTGEVLDEGEPLITLNKNYGAKWQVERRTINAPPAYKLLFKGNALRNAEDVIAIDDISVQDKRCDDAYFVVQDYSTYLDTYEKGQYFLSPIMTTVQGYNFRLEVYPRGTVNSTDGYMGLRFGLVQGPNDDDLPWPFCNKYMRMAVVDQNDDPKYALNRPGEYVTSEDNGGYRWNKPTSEVSLGYYGYANYMAISDLTQTNNYLKHDSLMVSIIIQDMNWVNNETCSGTFSRSSPVKKSYVGIDEGHESHNNHGGHEHPDGNENHHGGHHGGNHGEHPEFPDLWPHWEHHEEHTEKPDHHGEHPEIPDLWPHKKTTETPSQTTTVEHEGGHHEHHHGENHDGQKTMVATSTVIGITIASATFIIAIMSGVLCCIVSSHKQNMKGFVNNIQLEAKSSQPPAYDERVKFEPLPDMKA